MEVTTLLPMMMVAVIVLAVAAVVTGDNQLARGRNQVREEAADANTGLSAGLG